jgi:RNA polymerase sigma-70 factor, ECF subfamily
MADVRLFLSAGACAADQELEMMPSDSDLVARARQSDIEAFGVLIERYERSLLAAVLVETRDLQTAEDVVQETLLVAYRRLATLRNPDKFGPWLMRIARRRVVDAARSRRARVGVCGNLDSHEAAQGDRDQIGIEHEHLLSLVARLPARERVLIGYRYFDGHSMAEIAAITARPLGTVTKQVSRAIARLRSWWDKENLS